MEAFAMFCGIGIHNTKTYESTCKLMAKQVERKRENKTLIKYWNFSFLQRVALDCLSYHATATDNDTNWLARESIPRAEEFNLYRFQKYYRLKHVINNTNFFSATSSMILCTRRVKLSKLSFGCLSILISLTNSRSHTR